MVKKKAVKKKASGQKSKSRKTLVPMVAIGASAGGLEPFEQFFAAMPVDTGIAFTVIQHLSPDFESMMDELLSRHSTMDIKRVVDGLVVKPNTIYLNPPRFDMVVVDGAFKLTPRPSGNQLNLPIDIFFKSLASEYDDKAVAVILSGTGSDGTRGAAYVKAANGLVISQAPASAKFDGMPRSVIDSGHSDIAAIPSDIPTIIIRNLEGRSLIQPVKDFSDDPAGYAFDLLKGKFGTDFGYYKDATLRRRFERRVQLSDMEAEEYTAKLQNDPDELNALYADLLIDVTSFFRDPLAYKTLIGTAIESLGKIMATDRQIRIWVPGCSSGEEPYSIAIAFAEYARKNKVPLNVKIMATDVHQRSLGAAAQGGYPKESLKGLTDEQIERYFDKNLDVFQIKQTLRRLVVFSQHNLLRDPPFTRMDLVSCRNVMIYFQEEAQQKTLALFHFALAIGGFLFLGPSETLGALTDEFECLDRRWNIYAKRRDVRLVEATTYLPRDSTIIVKKDATVPFLTGRQANLQKIQRAHSEALELLLKKYAPSGFLLNKHGEVSHVFGNAGDYVRVDGGIFSNKIIDLIDPDLKLAVTTGLERLLSSKKGDFERRVIVPGADKTAKTIRVSLQALAKGREALGYSLLTLETEESRFDKEKIIPKVFDSSESSEMLQSRVFDLERDLQATEESLQSLVEELQTSNEELQATNEELMASNEELQSTNEELHSVNEELYTVSAEHQRKIDELTIMSDDMDHLLKATSIGIIFLDEQKRIRRFTEPATAAFNLMAQDIGRPFFHTTYRFEEFDLKKAILQVEESGKSIEREISVDEKEFYLSVLPYDTTLRNDSGIVMTLVDVTDFNQVNRDLLKEKQVFELVVNDLSEAFVRVDFKSLNIEMCNDLYAKRYGKTPDELIGLSAKAVIGDEFDKDIAIIKKQKIGDDSEYEAILNKGEPNERVEIHRLQVIGNKSGAKVAFQATIRDTTEEYQYRQTLEDLIAIETTPDKSLSEAIEEILSLGCNYLGFDAAHIVSVDKKYATVDYRFGNTPKHIGSKNRFEKSKSIYRYVTKKNPILAIHNLKKSPAKYTDVLKGLRIQSCIGVSIEPQTSIYSVILFHCAANREKQFTELEKTMTQLLAQHISSIIDSSAYLGDLESRKEELEAVNEGLNRFTYLASHDLQEPLRKIQQSGELLQMDLAGDLKEEKKYFFDIMMGSAARMRQLIEDLLAYSKSANEELVMRNVDMRELVAEAKKELENVIADSDAEVKIKSLPTVRCDSAVMTQVLINIMGNSLKYRKPDISPRITISAKTMQSHTRLEFKDNGIGMPLTSQLNIFDPFTRLHSRSEYSGSGIGLAICKSICDRHGWKLDVKSKVGNGTSIFINIPNSEIITEK